MTLELRLTRILSAIEQKVHYFGDVADVED